MPRELLAAGDVDGALVGGASLKAAEFLAIAKAAQSGEKPTLGGLFPSRRWTKWTAVEAFCTIGGWCC